LEVTDEIVGVFDPDRKSDQARIDTVRYELILGKEGMRCGGRMKDERSHVAEVRHPGEKFHAVQETCGCRFAALQREREH
jgi:hypothetical protein